MSEHQKTEMNSLNPECETGTNHVHLDAAGTDFRERDADCGRRGYVHARVDNATLSAAATRFVANG